MIKLRSQSRLSYMSEKMALEVKPLDLEGYRCSGKCPVFGKGQKQSCEALENLLNFSKSQFLHL